jgi:glycosyltransferase involved in cell wall biosynthesis
VYEAVWIGQYLREHAAQVLHVHTHFAGLGARACWWLRKFYGHSFSFTVHANDFFCNTEGQTVNMAALFRDASLIVTVSDYMVAELRKHFPTSAQRICRVYNGLDLAPFIAARVAAPVRQRGGILSVGRLIEKKGYDNLIAACAILRDRGLDFHCRIAGEGPLEKELRAQIDRLQLSRRVEILGPQSMAEIIRLLAEETQIFALACQTERHGGKDNLPTVLMEAMAASLPCVSTRLAGVPEMVVDGVTGLLCEEKDAPAFADLLAKLLQDPARCESLGQAGLAHAQTHFAKEKTARQLLRAFAERASLRWDSGLAWRHGLVGAYMRRAVDLSPQLRHQTIKARDKTFDLARFMGGA